jgi:hypothetical protein
MKLYTLFHGNSKKRMHPIMIDELHKCENYKKAREASSVKGWHEIKPASAEDTIWRQKSATRGGNRCVSVKRVGKNGQTVGDAGYIGKNGWNSHT